MVLKTSKSGGEMSQVVNAMFGEMEEQEGRLGDMVRISRDLFEPEHEPEPEPEPGKYAGLFIVVEMLKMQPG